MLVIHLNKAIVPINGNNRIINGKPIGAPINSDIINIPARKSVVPTKIIVVLTDLA
jgi:hypothetical protein